MLYSQKLLVVLTTQKDALHIHVGTTNRELKHANLYNKNRPGNCENLHLMVATKES